MFSTELILKKGAGNRWIVTSPLIFVWEEEKRVFYVPEGFETDLASIPAPFRNVLPVNDSHVRAAVLHDFLYSEHRRLDMTRKECDEIFLLAMTEDEVPLWKRYALYAGVRVGGWIKFNEC